MHEVLGCQLHIVVRRSRLWNDKHTLAEFQYPSNVYFSYLVQDSLYPNVDISTMWHCALVSCTPSQFIGLLFRCALFWCWVSLCVLYSDSMIELYFIMIVVTVVGILWPFFLFCPVTWSFVDKRSGLTMYFWFCKCAPPWVFPPLDIPFEYWIELVAVGLFSVVFRFSTTIFYRGVPPSFIFPQQATGRWCSGQQRPWYICGLWFIDVNQAGGWNGCFWDDLSETVTTRGRTFSNTVHFCFGIDK